jgi:tRNA threonylcarbamoyladenosine biosynthesis protein TsaB
VSWILALDASTSRSVLAIGEIGSSDLVSDVEDDGANQASARLQPRIEALLVRAGIRARDLVAIGCGRGPGTFTGTRVAVATAKGLALGLGVPIVPVSTLASLAASVPATRDVLPLLDARRGEVYGALFDTRKDDVVAKTDERCATLVDLLAAFADALGDRPAHLVGPGVAVQAEHVPPGWVTSAAPGPSDDGLWLATMAAHARGEAVDAAEIDAVYLRQSYAELGVNTPKRKQFKSPFIAG